MKRHRLAGPPCPTKPEHGPALLLDTGNYHCPHHEHVKPRAHTQHLFTDAEVRAAMEWRR